MAKDKGGSSSSVAKVSEISARSAVGFEDAIQTGIARASKTLRNVNSAWIKEQRVEGQPPGLSSAVPDGTGRVRIVIQPNSQSGNPCVPPGKKP